MKISSLNPFAQFGRLVNACIPSGWYGRSVACGAGFTVCVGLFLVARMAYNRLVASVGKGISSGDSLEGLKTKAPQMPKGQQPQPSIVSAAKTPSAAAKDFWKLVNPSAEVNKTLEGRYKEVADQKYAVARETQIDNDVVPDAFKLLETIDEENMLMKEGERRESEKDRYKDILQYKGHMVPLQDASGKSIYINAALIGLSQLGLPLRDIIVMQGPLDNTVEDVRQMAVKFQAKQIVTLVGEYEKSSLGGLKCERYWSAWSTETSTPNYKVRKAPKEWGELKQFHFLEFPDKGTPDDMKVFMEFFRLIQSDSSSGPVIVHCSAGIGRTGVFVCALIAEALSQQGSQSINPVAIIACLRQFRRQLVQTPDQLRFCFELTKYFLSQQNKK